MEAGEYGLTRGMCFVARRLEVVVVGRLMWISRCVLGATDTACRKDEATLPHLPLY